MQLVTRANSDDGGRQLPLQGGGRAHVELGSGTGEADEEDSKLHVRGAGGSAGEVGIAGLVGIAAAAAAAAPAAIPHNMITAGVDTRLVLQPLAACATQLVAGTRLAAHAMPIVQRRVLRVDPPELGTARLLLACRWPLGRGTPSSSPPPSSPPGRKRARRVARASAA